MSINIIGAGFPRTGTMTLKTVLQQLGYDQTYHYKDLLSDPSRLRFWKELDSKGTTDWNKLFDGYEASVDFPGYPHYNKMLSAFPNAKVILTIRPFTDWYDSTYSTIWQRKVEAGRKEKYFYNYSPSINATKEDVIQYVRQAYLHDQFQGMFSNQAHAEKIFYKHHNEVLNTVPAEQLLVYEVKDGWEPLCDFLNLPVPDMAFPHLNKKENFHAMVDGMINNKVALKVNS